MTHSGRKQASFRLVAAFAAALLLFAAALDANAAASPEHDDAFRIEDYFRLQRIVELAMSSDGGWLAWITESLAPKDKGVGRRLHLQSLSADGEAAIIERLADARRIAWVPGTHELAFLRADGGTSQVFTYDVSDGSIARYTRSDSAVISYLFAPDGTSLAYATRDAAVVGRSLYERFRNGDTGILVDPATTSSHDFLNPDWNAMVHPPPPVLWIAFGEGTPMRVPVPGKPAGHPGTYFWSSDSGALSIVFVDSDMPQSQLSGGHTSVGVFDLRSAEFRTIAGAFTPDASRPGVSYSGGEWIPQKRKLVVRRVTETDPWVSASFPDWAVADAARRLSAQAPSWHAAELYPSDLNLWPISSTEIVLENTVEGVHTLFVMNADKTRRSDIVADLSGSSELFTFSTDRSDAAFVNSSLTRPPEIYVRLDGGPARRLTDLNRGIAQSIRYRAREVIWESRDGVEISGWLLEPTRSGPGPWPLVTHVHGGPAFPFPNAFAPYFDYWPYPLEVYPAHGMAVFMPNYRGTHSYGGRIAATTGEEAVEDIVTGVRHLVYAGIADPARLGISGHSHGAWLGPLTMTRAHIFRAASFAEGVANSVVMYELMSGNANREIHDAIVGASLYEAPELYIEESPDLYFEGVSTASLFEGGAKTAALFMLGFAKAAERFGMPSEFIVYPQTGHNIALPNLQREAAARNLDWFDFWLNDRENPAPAKAEQYERWRAMKSGWEGDDGS